MRTWKWMFTAALLVSVSAAAQQPTESQPSAQPNAAAATPSAPTPAASDATAPAQTADAQAAPALPDYGARRRRIFGTKVLPNMVLAARAEESW